MDVNLELCDMNEGLERNFMSMVETSSHAVAIDLISMTLGHIPNPSAISAIIFKVIKKATDMSIVIEALKYLKKLLEIYPPSDTERRNFYHEALKGNSSTKVNLWTIVEDLARTSLFDCNIYQESEDEDKEEEEQQSGLHVSQLLLEYYVDVFKADFENFCEIDCQKKCASAEEKQCLVAKLLFSKHENISVRNNFEQLIAWISDIYKDSLDTVKLEILEQLQLLLCLMMNFYRLFQKCSDAEAIRNKNLDEVTRLVCNLTDKIENPRSLKLFLSGISVKWLRLKICEHSMHRRVYKIGLKPFGQSAPLTLRRILMQYMFVPDLGQRVTVISNSNRSSASKKKNYKGETALHLACLKGKYGSLASLLDESDADINATDNDGNTPLHAACLAKSFRCVQVLCNHNGLNQADHMIVNDEGQTALHVAVISNIVPIVKLLLRMGGMLPLGTLDDDNRTPLDIAETPDIKDTLEDYRASQIKSIQSEAFSKMGQPPKFDNLEAYSMYLTLLHYMLGDYVSLFKLKEIQPSADPLDSYAMKHLMEKCGFVKDPKFGTIVLLLDDCYMMTQQMPSNCRKFVEMVKADSTRKPVDLTLTLPLRAFELVLSIFE